MRKVNDLEIGETTRDDDLVRIWEMIRPSPYKILLSGVVEKPDTLFIDHNQTCTC
jgi:hypothetical protein